MRYLLDTNVISELIRNPQGKAARKIARAGEKNICTSIIVAAELHYGVRKKQSARLLKAVMDILGEIEVLALEPPVHLRYGEIRVELEGLGQPVGANDLWIAAHARAVEAILVTANGNEFKRVSGLKVENWIG